LEPTQQTPFAYYNQLRAMVAPFITTETLLRYDANFASVKTQQDFVLIITELDTIARQNNMKPPPLYVW